MTPVTLYIDPSVVTYLIQAVAGVVIAVGAAVGIYFRKAKKKVKAKVKTILLTPPKRLTIFPRPEKSPQNRF